MPSQPAGRAHCTAHASAAVPPITTSAVTTPAIRRDRSARHRGSAQGPACGSARRSTSPDGRSRRKAARASRLRCRWPSRPASLRQNSSASSRPETAPHRASPPLAKPPRAARHRTGRKDQAARSPGMGNDMAQARQGLPQATRWGRFAPRDCAKRRLAERLASAATAADHPPLQAARHCGIRSAISGKSISPRIGAARRAVKSADDLHRGRRRQGCQRSRATRGPKSLRRRGQHQRVRGALDRDASPRQRPADRPATPPAAPAPPEPAVETPAPPPGGISALKSTCPVSEISNTASSLTARAFGHDAQRWPCVERQTPAPGSSCAVTPSTGQGSVISATGPSGPNPPLQQLAKMPCDADAVPASSPHPIDARDGKRPPRQRHNRGQRQGCDLKRQPQFRQRPAPIPTPRGSPRHGRRSPRGHQAAVPRRNAGATRAVQIEKTLALRRAMRGQIGHRQRAQIGQIGKGHPLPSAEILLPQPRVLRRLRHRATAPPPSAHSAAPG